MLTIILCVLIGLVMGIVMAYKSKRYATSNGIGEYIGGALFGAFCGTFGGMVLMLLINVVMPTHYVKTKTYDLVSMKDTNSLHGRFFLGSRNVNECVYSFYRKNSDGSIEMNSVAVDAAKIFEDDSVHPRMDVYEEKLVFENTLWVLDCSCGASKYEFHIPKESVVNQFKLDAE